jgi:bis(5'-nucleosyl)-tetraphosphatase (symmetrical)
MTTYAIGDVQGCFDALLKLLKKIKFNSSKDSLIFCGDLVNRGGQSLDVLRWIYKNRNVCKVVLGNHDLSLLAQYYVPNMRKKSNLEFKAIFESKDAIKLMKWLKGQKLLIHNKQYNRVIVHAGIHPLWKLKRAKKEALRVEKKLKNNHVKLFKNMYGIKPNHWSRNLKGMGRTRFVINSFTRMRFLYKNGGMNFKAKGELSTFSKLIPWYDYNKRIMIKPQIIFGHWSALGLHIKNNTLCIDTGKVWGGKLTAYKLSKKYHENTIKSKNIIQV